MTGRNERTSELAPAREGVEGGGPKCQTAATRDLREEEEEEEGPAH